MGSGAVYTAQVFASNETLLLRSSLPFTWQRCIGAPETANIETRFQSGIFWNHNRLSGSSHYQTLIKLSTVHQKQVKYDDSLLRQIQAFVV